MRKSNSSNLFRNRRNSLIEEYFFLNAKYNKTNNQLTNFIKSTKDKINIIKYNNNSNIKLANKSLLRIIHKINDKFLYIQDYLKLIFISEKRETISIESKENFDKYINLLNNHNFFLIIMGNKNKNKKYITKLFRNSFKLIFKHLGIDFGEEVFNYLELMIYQEITTYHFEGYENLDELLFSIYNNNFGKNNFFIFNKKNKTLYPITNYSIKKIFDMANKKGNNNSINKNFVFKMKDINILLFEEKYKKYFEKLLLKNDYKFLYSKYHNKGGLVSKWKKYEKNNSLRRVKALDIIEFDDYLISAEQTLNKTLEKIEKKKNLFKTKINNENNYFIPIKDINDNIRCVNIQYIKLLHKKTLSYNNKNSHYIFNTVILDYSNKNITVSLTNSQINNFISNQNEKYIGINKNNNNYLVKLEYFQKVFKNWKILNKKYKFKIQYPIKEEKEFTFDEININNVKIVNNNMKINILNKNNILKKKIDKINNEINKDNLNEKMKNIFLIRLQNEEKKSRNVHKIKLSTTLDTHYRGRTSSDLMNSETNDSIDSNRKINRSMFLLNSFNTLPDKDFYSIRKVIKIIKRDHKKTDKQFKK